MSALTDWQIPGTRAEIYERIFVPALVGQWVPKGLALATPQPGEHVLDVACGTGALTRRAAESVGSCGRVVGLDISSEMLAVARRTVSPSASAAPIEWNESNAAVIPFDRETFDVVFCQFGLMDFPDRAAALKEMRRVLKLNGRLVVTVWGSISKCPSHAAMKASWARHFGADVAVIFDSPFILGNPDMLGSLVHDAGFSDICIQMATGTMRFPSAEDLVRSYGALFDTRTDENTRLAIIREVSVALQSYVGIEGLVCPVEAIFASARK